MFLRNFSRLLVGLVFIFSGLVKGVDPLGTAYRIEDYFIAYGIPWAIPFTLFLSIFLCTLEFTIGVSMLFNAWVKRISWLLFPLMIFFTLLTLVDAIWEPVPDCGCFGDAIKLSNWETFYKNIVLILLAAIVFFQRNKFKPPKAMAYGFSVLAIAVIGFIWFSVYNLNHLPMKDFREWKVGNDMDPEGLGEPDVYLLYRNIESGEEKEYLSPDYPWNDSVWMAEWEFVDQRIDDSGVLRAHNLVIEDSLGNVYTDDFIANPDYQFLVIAYDLLNTDKDAFEMINAFYREVDHAGFSMIVITSSLPGDVREFVQKEKLDQHLEFYFADDIVLKTMVRANPGIMLMKDGVVVAKWHHNDLPAFDEIKQGLMND